MEKLAGKTMIITGASSGLGRALALAAAGKGARLALCGRSPERLQSLCDALESIPALDFIIESFDLGDAQAIGSFVEKTIRHFGRLDILVNSAGANPARSTIESLGLGDLEYMMRLNCFAPAAFMKACHRPMAQGGGGLVLNILSSCCLFANEGLGAYTASKTALEGLTKVYRKEARKDRIRVSAIYPGGINTAFRTQVRPDYLPAEAVADAVLAFASLDPEVAPDELVLRPFVETNFP